MERWVDGWMPCMNRQMGEKMNKWMVELTSERMNKRGRNEWIN